MNQLKESQKKYISFHKEIEKIRHRIHQREEQIERLKKKESKMWDKSHWTDILIPPVIKLVKTKFPEIKWDDSKLTPMGICARVSIFGEINGKTIMLAFTPENLIEGAIAYDTGKTRTLNYPPNSIADLNGFNRIAEEIINIEQVYTCIRTQL